MIGSGFVISCCILLRIGHSQGTWTSKKHTPTSDKRAGLVWITVVRSVSQKAAKTRSEQDNFRCTHHERSHTGATRTRWREG